MGCVQPFTPQELQLLRTLYPTTPTAEVARRLGRTPKQVYNAADRYKVFKAGYDGERRKVQRNRRPAAPCAAGEKGLARVVADLPRWLAPQPPGTTSTPGWVTRVYRHVCMGPA